MMPYLVGQLGASTYGIWISLSALTSAYFLLDLGLTTAVMRFVAEALGRSDEPQANRIVNTALAIYCLLGLIVFAISALAAFAAPWWIADRAVADSTRHTVLVLGLNMAIAFPARSVAGILQAQLRHDLIALAGLGGLILQVLMTVAAVNAGWGLVGMAYAILIAGLLQNAAIITLSKLHFRPLSLARAHIDRKIVPALFGYSSWSLAIQIGEQFRSRSDPFVVGWLISAAAVTHYTVGAQLAEYYLFILLQATNFVIPLLARFVGRKDEESLRRATLLLMRLHVALGLFAAAGIIAFGRPFISLWMGEEFVSAYAVLVVLVTGAAVQFFTTPLDSVMYATAKHKLLAGLVGFEGVSKIVLGLWLGSQFGLIGVAIGTAVPQLLARLVWLPRAAARAMSVKTGYYLRGLSRVALVSVAVALACTLALQRLIVIDGFADIALCAVVFAVLYWPVVFLFALEAQDRRQLLDALPMGAGARIGRLLSGWRSFRL